MPDARLSLSFFTTDGGENTNGKRTLQTRTKPTLKTSKGCRQRCRCDMVATLRVNDNYSKCSQLQWEYPIQSFLRVTA